jgi:ribosomal-protein-serine acetyltransferase
VSTTVRVGRFVGVVLNLKSRAIPERLGFELEGVQRQAEWLYDHFVGHALYGMLADDWKDGKNHG